MFLFRRNRRRHGEQGTSHRHQQAQQQNLPRRSRPPVLRHRPSRNLSQRISGLFRWTRRATRTNVPPTTLPLSGHSQVLRHDEQADNEASSYNHTTMPTTPYTDSVGDSIQSSAPLQEGQMLSSSYSSFSASPQGVLHCLKYTLLLCAQTFFQ